MRDIEIRDVLYLARAEIEDAQGELKQLYLWRYDYLSTAAKAILGAGASLLVALVAAALQHKADSSWVPLLLGGVGAAAVLISGMITFRHIRLIYREYVTAQGLLGEATKVRTFLRLYDPEL